MPIKRDLRDISVPWIRIIFAKKSYLRQKKRIMRSRRADGNCDPNSDYDVKRV